MTSNARDRTGGRVAAAPDPPLLTFRRVTTPDQLAKVLRLRYQVYVVERGFERPEDHPGGIEQDRFDAVALHILCEHREGSPIGTVRLIPPSTLGYPLEEHCKVSIDTTRLPRDRLGEVSRLAITRRFQRRRDDPFNPDDIDEPSSAPPAERRQNDLVLGLYRELYQLTKRLGLTHWYAAMEDRLWNVLRRLGFEFQAIGPYIDYHGRRAPFLVDLAVMERRVRERSPALYRFFTEGL